MVNFKDQLLIDSAEFINIDEFGENHNIDGANMPIVIDNDLLKERQVKSAEGTYLGDLLFYVKKSDFGEEPAVSQHIKFDGVLKFINECQSEMDMYIITIGENKSW